MPLRSPQDGAGQRLRETLSSFRPMLDAIEVATCVVERSGKILCANELAKALLPRHRADIRASIGMARSGGPIDLRWALTPLRIGVTGAGFLAVWRPEQNDRRITASVRSAIRRWELTPRQGRVLALVARGLTNAAIAKRLGIGVGTVEFHLSGIFDKAEVKNRTTLIAKALKR